MKKTLIKLAGCVLGIGVVGALAFAAGAPGAESQDPLRVAIARAADEIAGSLNRLELPAGSAVAVRPARMELDGLFVDCPELAKVLRNYLRDALNEERAGSGFDFAVRAVDQNEVAPVEVNTSWWHDVRNGKDVLSARVVVTADRSFVGESETNWEIDAVTLTRRQRACLMKWTRDERTETVADGQQVAVWKEPSLRGERLGKYGPGEVVEVVGDLKPLDAGNVRDSWQLVWLSDRAYGFAKVGEPLAKTFTVTTVPSGGTVRRNGLRDAGLKVGEKFRDCQECPLMVVLPAGSFEMGSPSREHGRQSDEDGSVLEVTINVPFALGVYEVTVAQFRRFVDEADYSAGSSCWTYPHDGDKWSEQLSVGWRNPGFGQSDEHPAAVCELARCESVRGVAVWSNGGVVHPAERIGVGVRSACGHGDRTVLGRWRWPVPSCERRGRQRERTTLGLVADNSFLP